MDNQDKDLEAAHLKESDRISDTSTLHESTTWIPNGTGKYQPLDTHNAHVNARRSGSASVLVTNEKGEVTVERKTTDLGIAVRKRLSASSIPSIIPVLPREPSAPLINAEDALERTGGKGAAGAYSEHMYPLEVIAEKFHTAIDFHAIEKSPGLTSDMAEKLLKEHGPNVLTPPPKVPLWLLFLMQFASALMVLLEITALLCIILYIVSPSVQDNLYLGVLLFAVVIVTCYETYSQEAKSDSLMEQFRAMVPEAAMVIRDGAMKSVDTSELVLGDIIRVKAGDKVPADCRVILCESLKVDQSMITGEAEPVDSQVIAADPHALEAKNIIFNGSLAVDGACYAVVIRTGDATLIGTMVELTGDADKAMSTLKADIEYFVKLLAIFALCQAATVFIVGLSRGLDPIQVFINGFVVIMVGNVPQGLPTTITACLYIIAERMRAQNVFVKKLDIIETLGCCTCICTDKTGTLTLNQMTVANAWAYNQKMTAEGLVQEQQAAPLTVQQQRLLEIAALNSRVILEKKSKDSDELVPNGDATELGLYRFCRDFLKVHNKVDIESFRADNRKVHEIPFNSSFKWQMSIHPLVSMQKQEMIFLKGAPDVLLGKCAFYLSSSGEIKAIDEAFTDIYTAVYEDFGGNGERVLGFAMKPLKGSYAELIEADPHFKEKLRADMIGKETTTPINDMIFVGLITLMDPPRKEVPQAVKDCHTACVKVVMVTGDHPLTAAAIARSIGLITLPTRDVLAKERGVPIDQVHPDEAQAVVVHGSEIPKMTEEDWSKLVNKPEIVFARTSPEQKLIIVKEFTKAGSVTAMTGDGVNDSPALKQAAIGIAMGLNGSAVAKEAADVVLLDDNFASIVVGIREGRLLFANLKKSIAYTLAHLVPEVIPVLLWGYVGFPQPMGSMLTLCIDLLTELVPATSFAFEKAESLIMQVPPRDINKERLTSFKLLFYSYGQAGIILTAACFFIYFRTFSHYGVSPLHVVQNNNKYFPKTDHWNFVTNDGDVYEQRQQLHILQSVYAGWYLMIVIGQAAHVWTCRTCTVSIFEHGFFDNRTTNFGVVLAIALGCFVVYCPGIRYVTQARNPMSLELLYGALWVTAALWSYTEGRKWFTRTYPKHWLNDWLAW